LKTKGGKKNATFRSMKTKNKPVSDWREAGRLQALELQKKGWTRAKIAQALGVQCWKNLSMV
jgi:hypothetical protein